eukprot:g1548.t1
MQRSRWCKRGKVVERQRRTTCLPELSMAASSDEDGPVGGDSSGDDDDDIDWGTIKPKPGQTPDWDKILPKGVGEDKPDLPPTPPGLSELDPRERLMAYAGMLDWEPMDLDEKKEKEKTLDDLNQEMGDEWLASKLQSALLKSRNRNVRSNVNKAYINEWLDDEKEKLEETAEDLKEAYRRDAERIKQKMMDEFDKEARVMDIQIANIIARSKSNFTQFTGPLSDQTPFPAAIAEELAYLAEDEAAFYEELGVAPPPEGPSSPSAGEVPSSDVVTPEERNQMEAEMRTLSPKDVVKAAAAQAAAQAKKNASAAAAAARRSAEAAGAVVVVGAGGEDGALGAAVLGLFESELAEVGEKGAARVTSVYNVSLAAAKALREDDEEMMAALRGVKTLVVVPADSASGKGKKRGGGGGGGLGGMFGGGGGGGGKGGEAMKGEGLSDGEVVSLLEACGEGLKHVVCLSVGGASGGGGGLFGGGGGSEDKGFPGESAAEQGVIRVSKAKGLSFSTVRVSKLVVDDRGALDPLPLITPKNTPRADGRSSTLPEASRSVVANTLFRASYQPEARRNSTYAVSDFPSSWPVPAAGWVDEFLKLTGPELVRIPIPATFDGMSEGSGTFRAWAFLREWAQLWTKEGTGLTTPVKVFTDEETRRAGLHFDPSQTKYLSAREEREQEEQRAAKAKSRGESGPPSKARGLLKKEGGLDIIVEDRPYPRVRVVRANMGPKTIVKEMSEQLILDKLRNDVKTWIINQPKT